MISLSSLKMQRRRDTKFLFSYDFRPVRVKLIEHRLHRFKGFSSLTLVINISKILKICVLLISVVQVDIFFFVSSCLCVLYIWGVFIPFPLLSYVPASTCLPVLLRHHANGSECHAIRQE